MTARDVGTGQSLVSTLGGLKSEERCQSARVKGLLLAWKVQLVQNVQSVWDLTLIHNSP